MVGGRDSCKTESKFRINQGSLFQVHEKKTRKQGRGLENDHFFYNQPIMDFALPDGTVGSLKQTPRK